VNIEVIQPRVSRHNNVGRDFIYAGEGATINFSPVQPVSICRDQINAPSVVIQHPPHPDHGVPPNAWVPPLYDQEMRDHQPRHNPMLDSTSVSAEASDFDSRPSLKKPRFPEIECEVPNAQVLIADQLHCQQSQLHSQDLLQVERAIKEREKMHDRAQQENKEWRDHLNTKDIRHDA
jgi:hypothetical protein